MSMTKNEIFLLYALTEARAAIDDFQRALDLSKRVEKRTEGVEIRENRSVISALRSALQKAAAVSRVFWPAARKAGRALADARAKALCERVGLPNDPEQHGLGRRKWRDFAEHLDERIDEFLAKDDPDFVFFELVFHGPMKAITIQNVFLGFDPATEELVFLGDRHSLRDLVKDLQDVLARTSKALGRLDKS